jgi:hypothetical protein
MLAADANLATRDSAKIATGLGEQERADRASLEAARTAIAMAGTRLAERSPDAVGQQGDAERAQVQAMRGAAANPATRASAKAETGKQVQDVVARDAGKAGGDKAAAAANSGKVAETAAAAGQEVDAERAEVQSMKAAANIATRGSAKNETGKSVKDLSVRDAEKATANKATAEAPADKATADKAIADKAIADKATGDKATGDKATGDKATGDAAASAANSGKDAGTTADAASGIDPRYQITSYKDANGQEWLQLPYIPEPGEPGDKTARAAVLPPPVKPFNQTAPEEQGSWYKTVNDYYVAVGRSIRENVQQGWQTATEGARQFSAIAQNVWKVIGGQDLADSVKNTSDSVVAAVKSNAEEIGSWLNSPSNRQEIEEVGRRALLQLPAQSGSAPSGYASGVASASANVQVGLGLGAYDLSRIGLAGSTKLGLKGTLEVASVSSAQGGNWASKDGKFKVGLTGVASVPGSPFELEVSLGMTMKGDQTRIDSVSVEPLMGIKANESLEFLANGYAALTGTTPVTRLTQARAGGDTGWVDAAVDYAANVFERNGMSPWTNSNNLDPQLIPPFDGSLIIEAGTKFTVLNTDVADPTQFRSGWKGGVAVGVEVAWKEYAIAKTQGGDSFSNGYIKGYVTAREGLAFGSSQFVANAGRLIQP